MHASVRRRLTHAHTARVAVQSDFRARRLLLSLLLLPQTALRQAKAGLDIRAARGFEAVRTLVKAPPPPPQRRRKGGNRCIRHRHHHGHTHMT